MTGRSAAAAGKRPPLPRPRPARPPSLPPDLAAAGPAGSWVEGGGRGGGAAPFFPMLLPSRFPCTAAFSGRCPSRRLSPGSRRRPPSSPYRTRGGWGRRQWRRLPCPGREASRCLTPAEGRGAAACLAGGCQPPVAWPDHSPPLCGARRERRAWAGTAARGRAERPWLAAAGGQGAGPAVSSYEARKGPAELVAVISIARTS